ncbi:hypothetical protein GCM10010300_11950 [Streptomyces olivaceoviridis]|uniref:hypothetical protein n=1 Tax=Streptomyces olivaceoviridis TaxID=1921 RepID=UPI001675B837|nr:hypothetical protein [Streptomyces olivaceoviridis]GGY70286.1 hypothetical protein GCM10010300_11950 [Streptomyces olivaceoviridis]
MEIAGRKPPEGSWWDWEINACDAGRLRLAAGYDLTRHHGLEVIFTDPLFVSCPPGFQDPVFRPPTPEETARLARGPGDGAPLVVAFEADAGGRAAVSCLIAAEGLEIRPGFVPKPPRAGAQTAAGPRDWPGPPLPTD